MVQLLGVLDLCILPFSTVTRYKIHDSKLFALQSQVFKALLPLSLMDCNNEIKYARNLVGTVLLSVTLCAT